MILSKGCIAQMETEAIKSEIQQLESLIDEYQAKQNELSDMHRGLEDKIREEFCKAFYGAALTGALLTVLLVRLTDAGSLLVGAITYAISFVVAIICFKVTTKKIREKKSQVQIEISGISHTRKNLHKKCVEIRKQMNELQNEG